MDPVPEGPNESSLARSAWKQDKSRPAPFFFLPALRARLPSLRSLRVMAPSSCCNKLALMERSGTLGEHKRLPRSEGAAESADAEGVGVPSLEENVANYQEAS